MINEYTTQIIGARKEKPFWSLDEVLMSPEEIEQQERASQQKREARSRPKNPSAPKIEDNEGVIVSPATKQGRIYVPSLDLYVSEGRILKGKDWNKQTEKLHLENKRMPTIPEFIGFVNYLRSPEGQKAVPGYQAILDEIYKVEGNWRSENLDAFFTKKKDGMYVAYHKFDSQGKIIKAEEKLDAYHTKDKTPGIDLSDWLSFPTKQGLPRAKIAKGDLYYWTPVNEAVAGFDADSNWAGLYCYRGPTSSFASLGVRYVEPRSGEDARRNLGGSK